MKFPQIKFLIQYLYPRVFAIRYWQSVVVVCMIGLLFFLA